jgi:hypothetical protein
LAGAAGDAAWGVMVLLERIACATSPLPINIAWVLSCYFCNLG